jgi:hypothetical protein
MYLNFMSFLIIETATVENMIGTPKVLFAFPIEFIFSSISYLTYYGLANMEFTAN